MLCVVKYANSQIVGWILATDPHDARRQADNIQERDLAAALYLLEPTPRYGAYILFDGERAFRQCQRGEATALECGYLMMVG